ncbi:hypothetical protein M2475_000810 [Breznakia sp. PF5-3]|uniref:hypothetical protein n=1 Tax=unclassified Breznakia TaxID=2623764 RepID=UPI0024058F84|nr:MULTISPECIES: hypothetical protein [unclassified Breznakia]MDF9824472.1 hypothetical protein [Breznakia sp. PM6-1]MDF9835245.1 hypothetical protein [Breznakia sp. PF5-3]MDF9837427.1 hypothetical protein [Breznakia sp. PFB2-8]MDF9859363.1 hypothetical protein [Breznakia sp. PH5-24]
MKRNWIIIMIFCIFLGVGGCDKGREEHFTKQEAQTYIEEKYGEAFTFVEEKNNQDEDKRTFIFQAKEQDNLEFEVYSNRASGGLFGCAGKGCEYKLSDTYIEKSEQTRLAEYQSEVNDDTMQFDVENYSITIVYKTYADIKPSITKAKKVYKKLNKGLPKGANILVDIKYSQNSFGGIFPDTYVSNKKFNVDKESNKMQEAYVRTLYTYRLADTSVPQEFLEKIKGKNYVVHLQYGDTYKLYSLKASSEITYGVLFEIFSDLGYPIEGNASDYKVTYNSDVYHFSYEFYDSENKNTYYLKNGEQVQSSYFGVNNVAGVTISLLDKNVCVYDETKGEKISICFDKAKEVYVNNRKSNLDTAGNLISELDYVIEYSNNCASTCNKEERERYNKYLKLEEEFGSSLISYNVYEIDEDVYIIDDSFKDKKGFYFYKNLEKIYLPEKSNYESKENLEVLFACDIVYDEKSNTFRIHKKSK